MMLRVVLICLTLVGIPGVIWATPLPETPLSRAAEERVEADLRQRAEAQGLQLGQPVFIRIFKQESILEVWMADGTDSYRLFDSYEICSWSGDLGPKLKEGDRQSPEGFYTVTTNQMNPWSSYHLSFNLGFPNAYDRHHGRTGSFLMVHGDCVSVGCYAMATSWWPFNSNHNQPIEEIWTLMAAAFRSGETAVPVHIFPFRLTDTALAQHSEHQWAPFWQNLQEGYRAFESSKIPPVMTLDPISGRYSNASPQALASD